MQIKSKNIQEFQETVLNVIIENLNSSKDGFESSLIFSDYHEKYGLKIYQRLNECKSEEEISDLIQHYENEMVLRYSGGLFVDFKYLNFGYKEFCEWLEEFKTYVWFKNNGYIFNYELLYDENISEEYVKIVIEKSRIIL